MQAGLAYCILLTLDYIIIPGVVIICDLVMIPNVAIIHNLTWHAGIVLLANSDALAKQHDAVDKQDLLHTQQRRVTRQPRVILAWGLLRDCCQDWTCFLLLLLGSITYTVVTLYVPRTYHLNTQFGCCPGQFCTYCRQHPIQTVMTICACYASTLHCKQRKRPAALDCLFSSM